ncbi:putative neuropeptide Y receptor type 6 [Clytia hemisphaerica]|uniref:putative neuropeptide Y receptor type 6 n=1 Tax=Clytia hemisphaerica TaxID=252671 RepID=UPI0034D6EE7B
MIIENGTSFNISQINSIHEDERRSESIFFIVSYLMSSYYGNIFVIVALWKTKGCFTPVSIMILNISIANLAITTFPALTNLMELFWSRWLLGETICYITTFVQYYFQTVSNFCIMAIAIQRYRAIASPIQEMISSKRHTKFLLGMAWSFAAVIAIVATNIHSPQQIIGDRETCFNAWINYPGKSEFAIGSIIVSLVLYINPMFCITILYLKLIILLRRRSFPGDNKNEAQIKKRNKENARIALMFVVTVGLFQLCWLPTVLLQITVATFFQGRITQAIYEAETIISAIAFLYSAITPWVFTTSISNLRHEFLRHAEKVFPCITVGHIQRDRESTIEQAVTDV